MVILLAIGMYDQYPNDPDIDVAVKDLDVDLDIKNLLVLFRDKLRYKIYPDYSGKYPRIHWTKDELIDFLQKQAKVFADNVITNSDDNGDGLKFDGLVLII